MNNKNTYRLIVLTLAISLFGLIMVASSSSIIALSVYKDSFFFLKKQAFNLFLGGILFFVFSRIDYRKLKSWTPFLILFSFITLILIFFIGRTAYGSSRWIDFGLFNFQPSEFAKFSSLIISASLISRIKKFKEFKDYAPFGLILGMALLILVQPDFGTALLIVLTFLLTLLVSGMRLDHFVVAMSSFGLLGFLAIFSSGYRRQRFFAFLHPWDDIKGSGFQIVQSLYAFGSGGMKGVGLSLSKQKYVFLPAAYTDFIFAVIGEELGLLGTFSVVFLFAALAVVGFAIASRCKDPFGKALASAITISVVVQATINIGACIGVLPITGVPLPLISSGGTSLLMTLSALGILVNISGLTKEAVSE